MTGERVGIKVVVFYLPKNRFSRQVVNKHKTQGSNAGMHTKLYEVGFTEHIEHIIACYVVVLVSVLCTPTIHIKFCLQLFSNFLKMCFF